MDVLSEIKKIKVVPVVVLNDINETISKVGALIDGGVPIAEITFRTPCAADSIELASKTFKNALIGAGTIINASQCENAIKVGAKFIVSPGLSKEVFAVCKKYNVPYIPGIVTPTEIMEAISLGLTTLKFFPANTFGGLSAIKGLSSVFPQVEFMPTGGINEDNMLDFLAFKKIIAVGGSWMFKGTSDEIREKCKNIIEKLGK